jgi:hypothetical protein
MSKTKQLPAGMAEIRDAAQALGNVAQKLSLTAKAQEAELVAAVTPIAARYRPTLDDIAQEQADLLQLLETLVEANPQLFRKPRSIVIDGVRAGYRKEDDVLDWSDEAAVITRIRALLPEQEQTLIRSSESLVVDAVAQLEAPVLQQLGIRRIAGADKSFVKIGDSDMDRLVKALVADAVARTGQDEGAKPVKGKAKIKAGV